MQVIWHRKEMPRGKGGMDLKGKGVMVEFEKEQDLFHNSNRALAHFSESKKGKAAANSWSSTNSFVRIGSFVKPIFFPPPPPPGFNPSTAQFLFKKELKSSDVGPTRRIIIPKANAEKYLPRLSDGDGIFIYMDDIDGARVWVFRFRYWHNSNSQMFVLEKTGDFVKAHRLGVGDTILIYQDAQTGRYGIRTEKDDAKQIAPNFGENVPISYYRNYFDRDEMETYVYPENNTQTYMMNFLGGPDLTYPCAEQSMSFDSTNIYPHHYL